MKQMSRFHKVNAECTRNYDPYYGFKIIEQGTQVTVEIDTEASVYRILNSRGEVIGTASKWEFAEHFAIIGVK